MKRIGDQHGEIHAPILGGDGEGARSGAREVVIVNLPDNFDINDVFRSEEETSAPIASAPAPPSPAPPSPAPPTSTPTLAPTATPAAEVRDNPESSSRDRVKAPSLSIADLIDNHVHLEWYEAVAIAQHLCGVMVRDPAANIHHSLVEPWNVEITKSGGIQVLPGGSSSDPIVKQVGRVLGALLQDSIAPAELRLVASQASFEVPVYSSVEELSAALRHFERPGGLDAIRAAFQRGLEAKFSVVPALARLPQVVTLQAGDQSRTLKSASTALSVRPRPRSRNVSGPLIAAAAAILVATGLAFGLRALFFEGPGASTPEVQEKRAETQPTSPPQRSEIARQPVATQPVATQRVAPSATLSAKRPVQIDGAPDDSRRGIRPLAAPPTASVIATPSPRSTPPITQRSVVSGTSEFLEHERRASVLFASGRADEAALILDAIVLKNPFYQLDPARSSAEALTALRNSKRVFLPVLTRRNYEEARAAFDAGDFSLAVAKGERALSLLNASDAYEAPGDFSADVRNLVERATSARTLEEERIYTAGDPGVTPPRPLGRQLSTASLPRRSVPPTGRLEILVDRSGRVETVKLDTPLNGYHDRMIVSAVKAWHYKPALRNGRPVRFHLVMSINLPDL